MTSARKSNRRPLRYAAMSAVRAAPFDFRAVRAIDGASPDSPRDGYLDRRARGADYGDEVWDGVYVVAPLPSNRHAYLVGQRSVALSAAVDRRGVVYPGVSVTDRDADRSFDFRGPDLVVALRTNRRIVDRGAHFLGGPDLVVEVESRRDRSRRKFDFYARLGVREHLILEHATCAPLLHRLVGGAFEPVAATRGGVASAVLPLSFQARRGEAVARLTRKPHTRWVLQMAVKPDAKTMFEIYRESGPAGRYRVVYFTELNEHEREDAIARAMAGEHVYDGFVPDGAAEPRARIDEVLTRLNGGERMSRESIAAELAAYLTD